MWYRQIVGKAYFALTTQLYSITLISTQVLDLQRKTKA